MTGEQELVDAVEAAVARLGAPVALGGHGLDLEAAWSRHRAGEPVPDELRRSARNAALVTLSAEVLLARARAAVDGPLAVVKGPELAAEYPPPLRRPYWDLDLLVPDGPAAQQALVAAGFRTGPGDLEMYETHHHLAPLSWPAVAVPVEVHRDLGAQHWARVPPTAELLERAGPSATGVEGVLALDPVDHAVFVANHAWRTAPLGRLGYLVDVQALRLAARRRYADADERLAATARAWRLGRVWALTVDAIEGELLRSRPLTPLLKLFRRRLRHTEESPIPGPRAGYLYAAMAWPVFPQRVGGSRS